MNKLTLSDNPGLSRCAILLNSARQFMNGTSAEAYNAGHLAGYSIALTDTNNVGVYEGTFPAVAADTYLVLFYPSFSGAAIVSGGPLDIDSMIWNGAAITPATVPIGVISTKTTIYGNVDLPTAGISVSVRQTGPSAISGVGQNFIEEAFSTTTDGNGDWSIADKIARRAVFEIKIANGDWVSRVSLDADLTPVKDVEGKI